MDKLLKEGDLPFLIGFDWSGARDQITDAPLLRFLRSSTAVKILQQHTSRYNTSSHENPFGDFLTSESPMVLTQIAESLSNDDLDWLLKEMIEPSSAPKREHDLLGSQTWLDKDTVPKPTLAELLTIISIADRMPSNVFERAFEFIFSDYTGLSTSDAELAALKVFASQISPYKLDVINRNVEEGRSRGKWMTIEKIIPFLPMYSIEAALQTTMGILHGEYPKNPKWNYRLFEDLDEPQVKPTYDIHVAQTAALLASRLPEERRGQIYSELIVLSRPIRDLVARVKEVDGITLIFATRTDRRRMWGRALSQIRQELDTRSSMNDIERDAHIRLLPLQDRLKATLHNHRQSRTQEKATTSLPRLIVRELYRSRSILGLLRFWANVLHLILVTIGSYAGVHPAHIRMGPRLLRLIDQVWRDADHIPYSDRHKLLGGLQSSLLEKTYFAYKRHQHIDFSHVLHHALRIQHTPPKGLDALLADLSQAGTIPDTESRHKKIRSIFEQDYIWLRDCIINYQEVRIRAESLFAELSPSSFSDILSALSSELPSDFQVSTLTVLVPAMARASQSHLSTIAEIASRHATWATPNHQSILLSYVGRYTHSPNDQHRYLEQALKLASRQPEPQERQGTCGFVLLDAAEYAKPQLLPALANYLVSYHEGNDLQESYETALVTFAGRIGTNLRLLATVWPLVPKMKDASPFIQYNDPQKLDHMLNSESTQPTSM